MTVEDMLFAKFMRQKFKESDRKVESDIISKEFYSRLWTEEAILEHFRETGRLVD